MAAGLNENHLSHVHAASMCCMPAGDRRLPVRKTAPTAVRAEVWPRWDGAPTDASSPLTVSAGRPLPAAEEVPGRAEERWRCSARAANTPPPPSSSVREPPISCHTAPLLTGQPPGSHPRHTTRQHALTSSCHRLPAGGLPLGAGGKPQTQRKTESTAQSQTKKWGHGPPSRVLQS